MAESIYRTPVVMSTDGKNHVPLGSGQKLDPASLPIDTDILSPSDPNDPNSPLTISIPDLISPAPNNPLIVDPYKKLFVDVTKMVTAGDKILSVADNKIKSTLTMELSSAGQLVLKGVNGANISTVTLPVVPGLPTKAEFLTEFTPPNGASVLGGSGKGSYLHLQFALSNGTTKDLYINVAALIGGGSPGTPSTPSTVNPADLIEEGGGLIIGSPSGKIKVNCTDIKSCINTTVGANFLANGGLITDSAGKFKVDWTKMPSDGSGGGGFSGTKIGELDINEYVSQYSIFDWVLTDISKDKLLVIFLQRDILGDTNQTSINYGSAWTKIRNPFGSRINYFTSLNPSDCHASLTDELRSTYYGPDWISIGMGVQLTTKGGTSCSEYTTYPNTVVMMPDNNYSTVTIKVAITAKKCKIVAYQ